MNMYPKKMTLVEEVFVLYMVPSSSLENVLENQQK